MCSVTSEIIKNLFTLQPSGRIQNGTDRKLVRMDLAYIQEPFGPFHLEPLSKLFDSTEGTVPFGLFRLVSV